MSTLRDNLLPKLKIMKTFPLEMRSDHACIGGINLGSLEATSGIQDTNHLVSLFSRRTPTPILICATIESHQIEIGIKELFLDLSHSNLHQLSMYTWSIHLWELLINNKLHLTLPGTDYPSSRCLTYNTIIDALIRRGWKNDQLKWLN